jgi:hypothetical protein
MENSKLDLEKISWNEFNADNSDTYPKEGYEVLVTDGKGRYDVAWYLMSGEYKWTKHVSEDVAVNFELFRVEKWAYLKD